MESNPTHSTPLGRTHGGSATASGEARDRLCQKVQQVCEEALHKAGLIPSETIGYWIDRAKKFDETEPRLYDHRVTLHPDKSLCFHFWNEEDDQKLGQAADKTVFRSLRVIPHKGKVYPQCDLISIGEQAAVKAQKEEQLAHQFCIDTSPEAKLARPFLMKPSDCLQGDWPAKTGATPWFLQIQPLGLNDLMDSCYDPELSLASRISLLSQAATVLLYLEKRSTVHHDIKPENLLLMGKAIPWLKVIDFGLATAQGAPRYGGTLLYSPKLDPRGAMPSHDAYGLMVSAFVLLRINEHWDEMDEQIQKLAERLLLTEHDRTTEDILTKLAQGPLDTTGISAVFEVDEGSLDLAKERIRQRLLGVIMQHKKLLRVELKHLVPNRTRFWGYSQYQEVPFSKQPSSDDWNRLIALLETQERCSDIWEGFDQTDKPRPDAQEILKRLDALSDYLIPA